MTNEFAAALRRVLDDGELDVEGAADMVAVGVLTEDCREFRRDDLEGEELTDALLNNLVMMAVATGVQIERARWHAFEEAMRE